MESYQSNDEKNFRQELKKLEEEHTLQRRIAYVAGLLKGDITVRTLLESLTEGIVIIEATGRIIIVNKRAEEMFGFQHSELIGKPLEMLLPERFMNAHVKHTERYFHEPRIRPMGLGMDLSGRRKDGSEFSVEIGISHLNTEAGPVALAFVSDITKRKAMERELEDKNRELDAFAHMVAHDLNANLSLQVGYSELLASEHDSMSADERSSYLNALVQSGRKMSSIVSELLLFAKTKKGEKPMELLDTKGIIADALHRLSHLIRQSHAEVLQPESYPSVMGHPIWVEEVWLNLISNAVKYGGSPPVIELGAIRDQPGKVTFWVRDNGVGLTQDDIQQLFDTPIHPSAKGFGLGLSIVKRILEKLDGNVRIESEVGKGSTFFFTLPEAP